MGVKETRTANQRSRVIYKFFVQYIQRENSHWSETGRERKRKKNSGLRSILKVFTSDIQIKWSGFKISNSKVFSSGHISQYLRQLWTLKNCWPHFRIPTLYICSLDVNCLTQRYCLKCVCIIMPRRTKTIYNYVISCLMGYPVLEY